MGLGLGFNIVDFKNCFEIQLPFEAYYNSKHLLTKCFLVLLPIHTKKPATYQQVLFLLINTLPASLLADPKVSTVYKLFLLPKVEPTKDTRRLNSNKKYKKGHKSPDVKPGQGGSPG